MSMRVTLVKMKKQMKKWGESLLVTFTEEDQKIYGMKEGSVIDLSDMVVDNSLIGEHEVAEDQLSAVLSNKQRMKESDNGAKVV